MEDINAEEVEQFSMPISSQFLMQSLAISTLLVLLIAVVFRLSRFPGLEGDEAWVGLRALTFLQDGFFSVHGMNWYTGAAFQWLVAADVFSIGCQCI